MSSRSETFRANNPERVSEETFEITLPDFHSLPPYYKSLEQLRLYLAYSLEDAAEGKRGDELWDPRILTLYLPDPGQGYPHYEFVLDTQTFDYIEKHISNSEEPSQEELLRAALEGGRDGAVEPVFLPDAMNAINATYYSSSVAFDSRAGLATMYAKNRPLNEALGNLLATASSSSAVRIKEVASGSTEHWVYIVDGLRKNGKTELNVTLTDVVAPHVMPPSSGSVQFASEAYSLFDNLPVLEPEARYDVLITTYGFDSVWLPEDMHLKEVNGQWYRSLHRVKVAEWNPRRGELLDAMRAGRPLAGGVPEDYDGIAVETVMEPIDIRAHPFGDFITKHGQADFNFPGGLIKRIVEAFESQLSPSGIFVSCDVGNFGKTASGYTPESFKSGVAARYKSEDYVIAKRILEEKFGLDVALYGLDELASQYLPLQWNEGATPLEQEQILKNPTNGVLVARKK